MVANFARYSSTRKLGPPNNWSTAEVATRGLRRYCSRNSTAVDATGGRGRSSGNFISANADAKRASKHATDDYAARASRYVCTDASTNDACAMFRYAIRHDTTNDACASVSRYAFKHATTNDACATSDIRYATTDDACSTSASTKHACATNAYRYAIMHATTSGDA